MTTLIDLKTRLHAAQAELKTVRALLKKFYADKKIAAAKPVKKTVGKTGKTAKQIAKKMMTVTKRNIKKATTSESAGSLNLATGKLTIKAPKAATKKVTIAGVGKTAKVVVS
jgi:ribosomal protein L7/L12